MLSSYFRCKVYVLVIATILASESYRALFVSGIQNPVQSRLAGTYTRNDKPAVPTLLIIGTAKGGTTDLYYELTDDDVNNEPNRPDLPLRSVVKEVAFLHRFHPSTSNFTLGSPQHRSYLKLLSHSCANARSHDLANCLRKPEHYTIDASPRYDFHPGVPQILKSFSPNSKVIMLLRAPTDRSESLYYHWSVQQNLWPNVTINQLADEFFHFLRAKPGISAVLDRLLNCRTVQCQADGWRHACALGLVSSPKYVLFSGGLYRYILSTWRQLYFKPSRVMVIDSHTYFLNRESVMEQVVAFMYGRSMTAAERILARTAAAHNVKSRHNATNSVVSRSHWRLSQDRRTRLEAFYNKHVMQGLHGMLQEMRSEGAWVVGFEGSPWPVMQS